MSNYNPGSGKGPQDFSAKFAALVSRCKEWLHPSRPLPESFTYPNGKSRKVTRLDRLYYQHGRKFWVVLVLLLLVNLFSRSGSQFTNTRDAFVKLNQPAFANNPLLERVTYNSLNDPQTLNYVLPTPEAKQALSQTCSQAGLDQLQYLTCLHYVGSQLGGHYYTLAPLDILERQKLRVADLLADQASLTAAALRRYPMQGYNLNNLRDPDFMGRLGAKELQDLGVVCYQVLSHLPKVDWLSYEYDAVYAESIATREACGLLTYMYHLQANPDQNLTSDSSASAGKSANKNSPTNRTSDSQNQPAPTKRGDSENHDLIE